MLVADGKVVVEEVGLAALLYVFVTKGWLISMRLLGVVVSIVLMLFVAALGGVWKK